MGKTVFISEKPSVAQEFAKALELSFRKKNGYFESENTIVTWCVGHLVTMAYPDAYDPKYRRWSLDTIPFIPDEFRYQIIENVQKQFDIVKNILTAPEVEKIYICTDSGREGEYIYRLVAQMAGVKGKKELRVWIDSQTKEEILRGIREAKEDSAYDNLGAAAYLRAKEDYLMGINFSRAMTLRYGDSIASHTGNQRCVVAIGRVMTCVLGIVVKREREIRDFVKTPFYRIIAGLGDPVLQAEWQVCESSRFYNSPRLYSSKGFREEKDALELIESIRRNPALVQAVSKKQETKNPPLLYNLAELQNECSNFFKISPDETLQAVQTLYERKLTTYPRTDARVLSSAVAKEITRNLSGLGKIPMYREAVRAIEASGSYKNIGKTRYTDDKAITDHYAIIPTGQGLESLSSVPAVCQKVYELICRRFLSVFFPAARFRKITVEFMIGRELFTASGKICLEEGYLQLLKYSFQNQEKKEKAEENTAAFSLLKKGMSLPVQDLDVKQGETSPPKRYNSGSMILTMENAGQFIEEEELREQIRGSGIGTSATRAEILNKLIRIRYLALNKKTQIITPTHLGEMIYDTVDVSLRPLLDPALTASWEIGLTRVVEGTVSEKEYLKKLEDFISRRTNIIKETDYRLPLQEKYRQIDAFYPAKKPEEKTYSHRTGKKNRKSPGKKEA